MKNQFITILEKLDHKKTNITYSKDRTIGIEMAIDEIKKVTGIQKCPNCKKYYKKITMHQNIHLKFQ